MYFISNKNKQNKTIFEISTLKQSVLPCRHLLVDINHGVSELLHSSNVGVQREQQFVISLLKPN